MWSILLAACDESQKDQLLAELWERATAGIIEEPGACLRAFFEDQDTAQTIARDFAAIASDLREEPLHSPPLSDYWEPFFAGSKFIIVPPGQAVAAYSTGRTPLEMNAAMAFGSGRHETTQLCLQALENSIIGGATVIDVGCGSGILSLAATHLSAACVVACDIHADAIDITRAHFKGPVFQGSVDAIRDSTADIVIANISARINDHIAADLRRILKPSGILVASGFIRENPPHSFTPVNELSSGDWLCWICTRAGIHPAQPTADPNLHPRDWWM